MMSILIYSILAYPITLEGRRGTIYEFATIPSHVDSGSALFAQACLGAKSFGSKSFQSTVEFQWLEH